MAKIEINPGDPAPPFRLPRDGGGEIALEALRGGLVVLYFYPKDNTPGCTVEARDFTNLAPAFAAAGATVIGVSKDSVKKHDGFKQKHELEVVLASDEQGDALDAYGVWGTKLLYGRTFLGIERATFLIDRDGVIRRVWRKVKVKGHAEEVLAAVKAL